MTKVLAVMHSGIMKILMRQKSVLGNLSDELNYSRIGKVHQAEKKKKKKSIWECSVPLLLKGTFSSEHKIFA